MVGYQIKGIIKLLMKKIPFYKMSGSGNDFIIIDNRKKILDENSLPRFIIGVCRRKMSAGADGVIIVEETEKADFKWRFFNSDASVAEMCGNGARCVARFADLTHIAGPNLSFETIAGTIKARVNADGTVKIKMTDPFDLKPEFTIKIQGQEIVAGSVNTGVPHVVVEVDDIETVDVMEVGRAVRYHERFAPDGANANFIQVAVDGKVKIRTYERGVEGETLACGTGNVAAALIVASKHGFSSPVELLTRSNSTLKVYFKEKEGVFYDVFLQGDARVIYKGELWEDAWNDQ